jgi:hypothetical protein
VLTPFCVLALLRIPTFGRRVRTFGRRLSTLSAVAMLGLGALLADGWYDALVQRLDIGT